MGDKHIPENLADPSDVKKRNKRILTEQEIWQNALRNVMAREDGVTLIKGIMDRSKMFANDLYAGSTNDTMYRLGQRDVGMWLFKELERSDSNLLKKIITGDN